jgi:outer membrane protein
MQPFLRLALLMSAALSAAPVSAETLQDAIAAAYSANPQVAAARAQLRQLDEGVPIAWSNKLPSIGARLLFAQDLSPSFGNLGQTWQAGVSINQAIWEGGRLRTNVAIATARVEAARARLIAIEYRVIVQTVTAYADVLRTAESVRLNENQVKVLQQQLRASRDRFEVGDLTRTDVAQSEARLAAAEANLMVARSQEVQAEQAYERLVGRPPKDLAPLPAPPPQPANMTEARDMALATNPDLTAARLDEKVAEGDVRLAKQQRAPAVGVEAQGAYTRATGPFFGISGFVPRLAVTATMPLYTGGLIAAQVRQAKARESETLELIDQTERVVAETASNSWIQLKTSEAVIQSAKTAVGANALASEGVRRENEVGSRDILDVLNAEQELLNARVTLVQAERDRYVAIYQLLETIGRLEPVLADVGVGRYDPNVNFREVKGDSWREFAYGPDPHEGRAQNRAPLVGPK